MTELLQKKFWGFMFLDCDKSAKKIATFMFYASKKNRCKAAVQNSINKLT